MPRLPTDDMITAARAAPMFEEEDESVIAMYEAMVKVLPISPIPPAILAVVEAAKNYIKACGEIETAEDKTFDVLESAVNAL